MTQSERKQWENLTHAKKTIFFKPPMWEDIKHKVNKLKESPESVAFEDILQINNGHDIFDITFCKTDQEFSIEVNNYDMLYKKFKLNEKGYIQAVYYCLELFNKEK